MKKLPEGRGALVPNRQILYNKQCFPWGVMPLKRERPMAEVKKKVYLETSFVSYLTGRATTREPVASWQAASRQWWEAVRPSCDLFVSRYVVMEAEKGDAEQVARRTEVIRDIPRLDVGHEKIEEVAKTLISEHALPENEATDAYHIATAAFYAWMSCLHGTAATWPTSSLCREPTAF